jgi:hypothetical protein
MTVGVFPKSPGLPIATVSQASSLVARKNNVEHVPNTFHNLTKE